MQDSKLPFLNLLKIRGQLTQLLIKYLQHFARMIVKRF